jgi:polysaccharide pyruvyl transferase WcaK-like protein
MNMDRNNRVGLIGTFDVDNYGDCLFPIVVADQLKKRLGQVEVFPISPTNRLASIANYSKVYGFNEIVQLFSCVPSCFIVGGGDLLTTSLSIGVYPDRKAYPPSVTTWLLPMMIASAWDIPIIFNAVGVAQVGKEYMDIARQYFSDVALLAVRDRLSADKLASKGIQSEVQPDCAILTPDILSKIEWENIYREIQNEYRIPSNYIIAQYSLCYHNVISFAHRMAEMSIQTGLPLVLLPICNHLHDLTCLRIVQKILSRKAVKSILIDRVLNTIQTSALLAHCCMYIGTSLHGAIVTLSFGKRALSISTSAEGKHFGVLSEMGYPECHETQIDAIPTRGIEILKINEDAYAQKVSKIRKQSEEYWNRVAQIIASQGPSRKSTSSCLSQDPESGKLTHVSDPRFESLNGIALRQIRKSSTIKNNIIRMIHRNKPLVNMYYAVKYRFKYMDFS